MPNARHVLALLLGAVLIASACAAAPAATSPGPTSATTSGGSPAPSGSDAAAPSHPPSCASLEAPPDEGRAHLPDGETGSYDSYPPTSGPHAITPAKPGWYDVSPPIEQLVHSLEHGFIVVYRSGLDATDEAALKTRFDALVADGFGALISVPDESIKDPMTLTAWDRLQRCVRADPDAFEGFVRDHYAQAPEASVACSFQGAADLPVCQALLANSSPAPSRSPTSADDALLTRIPEALRAACRPTSILADGADGGWDCFPVGGDLVYGYASFPSDRRPRRLLRRHRLHARPDARRRLRHRLDRRRAVQARRRHLRSARLCRDERHACLLLDDRWIERPRRRPGAR